MAKLPAAIKRRSQPEPQQQHENIMPRALEAIINSLDPDVEIEEIYISLRHNGASISYDYKNN